MEMKMKTTWIAILGVSAGLAGGLLGRPQLDQWMKDDCCGHKPQVSGAVGCPVHFENDGIVTTDSAELDRLRRAMRDGVFAQWFALGRAPTPEEIGAKLGLDQRAANTLLDQLEVC